EELIELRINRLVDGRHQRTAVERRGRRDGDFRHALGMRLDELEMLDHRMAGKSQLAGDANSLVAGGDPGKGNSGVHDVALDAVETPEEVEVPPGAAELAGGHGLQPDLLLLLDRPLDLAVLHCLAIGSAALAFRALFARLLHRRRAQQAANAIGAERVLRPLQDRTFLFFCRRVPVSPIPPPQPPRSVAALSTARPRTGYCLPRWRRSRIAARGIVDRGQRISPPARCGA